MTGNNLLSRWVVGAVLLAAADCAGVIAVEVALTSPAQAQLFDNRFPFLSRQRPRSGGGGFFGGLFGGGDRSSEGPVEQAPVDNSRAPPPRKPDPKAEPVTPTTSVVVLGDGMADWLAYGLEDAFSDSPEIAIIRKNKVHSGLVRYDQKGDLDWWHVARDSLNQEKANYVVMMLGVSDRQNIRERDLAKDADKKKGKEADKSASQQDTQTKDNKEQVDDQEQGIVAPESPPGKKVSGVVEFRTDQWAEIYSKRIDDTLAALKSKGAPVFWVGLPSIRGPKSTADAVYLNDLYRARAERAGAIYIDVWDGFVDEAGKFSNFGPDYEGQMRRLRSNDGVFFSKSGAIKLAHYVEREIRRHMNSRAIPVALPSGPVTPAAPDGKPAARPTAGPVIPLTVTPGNSEELLGGGGNSAPHGDAIATRVLVKGEPVIAPAGRADDFALQRDSDASLPAAAASPEALASTPADTPRSEPAAAAPEKKTVPPKSGSPGKTTQAAQATQPAQPTQATQAVVRPRAQPRHDDVPRPPRGLFNSGGGSPFSFFR
jgi:uncharacterized protein